LAERKTAIARESDSGWSLNRKVAVPIDCHIERIFREGDGTGRAVDGGSDIEQLLRFQDSPEIPFEPCGLRVCEVVCHDLDELHSRIETDIGVCKCVAHRDQASAFCMRAML